jgi:putative spermidine/putrescine transport system permease protein
VAGARPLRRVPPALPGPADRPRDRHRLLQKNGTFTWANISALGDPVVLTAFGTAGLSLLTAAIGAIVGALVCYAAAGSSPQGAVRTRWMPRPACSPSSAASCSRSLHRHDRHAGRRHPASQGRVRHRPAPGTWLYELPGLILPYIYFQIPLMVITFLPALSALKPQWAEANLTLGGTRASFWLRIGVPVLAPSFLASFLLLFANAFSSYATAAALASQGSQIVPLQIRAALTSETVLGRENLAGALALGMIVVVGVVMALYALVQRRAARWQS